VKKKEVRLGRFFRGRDVPFFCRKGSSAKLTVEGGRDYSLLGEGVNVRLKLKGGPLI